MTVKKKKNYDDKIEVDKGIMLRVNYKTLRDDLIHLGVTACKVLNRYVEFKNDNKVKK